MWANAIEKTKMVSKWREVSALLYISAAPPHPRWCCCCGEENGLYKNGKKKYQLPIASEMGGNNPRVISCKQSPMGQVAALDWMFSLPRSEWRSWSSRSCPFLFPGEVSLIFLYKTGPCGDGVTDFLFLAVRHQTFLLFLFFCALTGRGRFLLVDGSSWAVGPQLRDVQAGDRAEEGTQPGRAGQRRWAYSCLEEIVAFIFK